MLLGFEHVGMTCSSAERTIAFYRDLLGLKLLLRRSIDQGEVLFLDAGGGMLEILIPSAPHISRFRDVPPDEVGLRHLTFAYDDIDEPFARLEAAGAEIIDRPRPALNTAMLRRVAFVRDPDGMFVELVERAPGR
jgi:glyoxylase I family protein